MRFAGSASWSISIDSSNMDLEWALWFRAAERIEVSSGGVVTAPPEVIPMPKPTLASSEELVEGWLWWWRTLLDRPGLVLPRSPGDMARLNMFSPPDFPGLADYPSLRRVVSARWSEANEWYSNRKRAVIMDFQAARGPGREFAIVRAVEAEIGRKTAPFSVRIIVLPVLEQEIRPVDAATFLSLNGCAPPSTTTTGCVNSSMRSPEPGVPFEAGAVRFHRRWNRTPLCQGCW